MFSVISFREKLGDSDLIEAIQFNVQNQFYVLINVESNKLQPTVALRLNRFNINWDLLRSLDETPEEYVFDFQVGINIGKTNG